MTEPTKTARDGRITLPDGRLIAYTEVGDAEGAAVFFFHGVPGSRRVGLSRWSEDPGAAGLRLISVDRPGIGDSDPFPRRRLLDWPADVAALADALEIEQFSVLGGSGGGPHALACAYVMPDRLRSTIVVNGLAPIDLEGAMDGMTSKAHWAWWMLGHVPGMCRMAARAQARMVKRSPSALPPRMARWMAAEDRRAMSAEGVGEFIGQQLGEAFRQGPSGVARDLYILSRPWGFDLRDVRSPVYLWQGTADRNVPPSMGRAMETALPNCRARYIDEAGHLLGRQHLDGLLDPARA